MRSVGADPDDCSLRLPLELRLIPASACARRACPRRCTPRWRSRPRGDSRGPSAPRRCASCARCSATPTACLPTRASMPCSSGTGSRRRHANACGNRCASPRSTRRPPSRPRRYSPTSCATASAAARDASDLLLPRADLGTLFPDPAARFIEQRGGRVRMGAAVRRIAPADGRFLVDAEPRERYDAIVLAVAPQHAPALMAGIDALDDMRGMVERLAYEPIHTCYLQYDRATLPVPMLGLRGAWCQWVFDRGRLGGAPGLLAAVVSALRAARGHGSGRYRRACRCRDSRACAGHRHAAVGARGRRAPRDVPLRTRHRAPGQRHAGAEVSYWPATTPPATIPPRSNRPCAAASPRRGSSPASAAARPRRRRGRRRSLPCPRSAASACWPSGSRRG